jgi:hypothetical protein
MSSDNRIGLSDEKRSALLSVIVLILVNFVVSTVIPLLLEKFHIIDVSQALLLGALILIFIAVSELLYFLRQLETREKRATKLWSIQHDFESRLSNIREAFEIITAGIRKNPDLFSTYFGQRLIELENSITEAANRDKLYVSHHHIVNTEVLLQAFAGKKEDIFRGVHLFEDNDWFFGSISKGYFFAVYGLVRKKKIKSVKRLMLYSDVSELEDFRSKRLMKFHELNSNYEYRVMKMETFKRTLADFANIEVDRDFGIWGDHIIYLGQDYRPDNVLGYYRRGIETISEYTKFFEKCWDSPDAIVLTNNLSQVQSMTCQELFETKGP